MINWDTVEGNWKQFRGAIRKQWGRLTDDDVDVINGSRDQLEGRIQERYGKTRDAVRTEVDDFLDSSSLPH